jgi:hypothetical protein
VSEDRWLTTLEVCGTPGNVEMAAWVHDWLVSTAERLWEADRRREGLRGASDHARYLSGVVRGFTERLTEGAAKCRQEGLVWVGDPAAGEFVGKRWGKLRMVSYRVSRGDSASNAGFSQGKSLVLHRPVAGTTGRSGGRLGVDPDR